MLFMVIETFRDQNVEAIYRRLREKGRMMPDGLSFIDSWVAADLGRCFQLMECNDAAKFQHWIAQWADLMEFEVVPVSDGDVVVASKRHHRAVHHPCCRCMSPQDEHYRARLTTGLAGRDWQRPWSASLGIPSL